jgi:peptide chain release factor 2
MQAFQKIKTQYELYKNVTESFSEIKEIIELFQDNEEELKNIKGDVYSIAKQAKQAKLAFLLNQEHDTNNCFLHINAGAGGTESQDWAEMLLRMYIRFCEQHKLTSSIIDYQQGDEAGIKSATLFIKGKYPFGLFKGEQGIHRLVRISPFDSNKRRHTSFAAVTATPELPDVEVSIDPKDLKIDTYRASGAGGQHVNKTDSAVRITHIPTNIVVQCQNERSQLQNKETALKMLKSKLYQRKKEEQEESNKGADKKKIEWGSQIRSYILQPYQLVKDHRTQQESGQPDLVLDGYIMKFIEQYLVHLSTT